MKYGLGQFGRIAGAVIGFTGLGLIVIGPPGERERHEPIVEYAPPVGSVSANGFTIIPNVEQLPAFEEVFPEASSSDPLNANCLACHSPSMIGVQPNLPPEKWREIVIKMRDVYHAPITNADVPLIVSALVEFQRSNLRELN